MGAMPDEARPEEEETPDIFGRAPAREAHVDRASESIVSSVAPAEPLPIGAISSSPLDIAKDLDDAPVSVGPALSIAPVPHGTDSSPEILAATIARGGRSVLPLRTVIGIGAAIFVVAVGLALLLFR